ncbi:MAG: hypothetical protein N2045_13845 [Fimbriimonadales bacterium]|nr:hypothetical protein [Fimbriimonadales bacterium]
MEEKQAPPTAQAQAAQAQADAQEAPDIETLRQELEVLKAKHEKAMADLHKHRTRQEQLEAARKQAEEEALARKPLEEQLEVLKKENAALKALEAEAEKLRKMDALKTALLEAGVDPRKLGKAARFYLDDAQTLGNEPDLKAWLKENPEFVAQPGPATTTGANLAGNKPKGPATLAEAISQHLRR